MSVTLTVQANDSDGTVAKVDFFQGNTPIATVTPPAPFIFTVNNLAQGSYIFTAIATDNQGATTTSNQATITVTPATAQVYYIYTDQLNTPRAITDQTNKVIWRWDNQDPFGANVPDEDRMETGSNSPVISDFLDNTSTERPTSPTTTSGIMIRTLGGIFKVIRLG